MKKIIKVKIKVPKKFECSKCWCIFSSDEYTVTKVKVFFKQTHYQDKCPECNKKVQLVEDIE